MYSIACDASVFVSSHVLEGCILLAIADVRVVECSLCCTKEYVVNSFNTKHQAVVLVGDLVLHGREQNWQRFSTQQNPICELGMQALALTMQSRIHLCSKNQ